MDFSFLRNLSEHKQPPSVEEFKEILQKSKEEELSLEEVNRLINCIYVADFNFYRELLIETSTELCFKVFGNKAIAMAPVEISNHCSSECYFCGWLASKLGDATKVHL